MKKVALIAGTARGIWLGVRQKSCLGRFQYCSRGSSRLPGVLGAHRRYRKCGCLRVGQDALMLVLGHKGPGGPSFEEEESKMIVSMQSIPRAQTPEELARIVSFLTSADANFIADQSIDVDEGLIRVGAKKRRQRGVFKLSPTLALGDSLDSPHAQQ
jgi:hypothetical protein